MVTWRYLRLDKHRMVPPFFIMKSLVPRCVTLLVLCFFTFTISYSQTHEHVINKEQRNVVSSPITEQYKASVKQGYYKGLTNLIMPGYRGLYEFANTFGRSEGVTVNRIEFTTTQGYQFNPYLFIGGGVGVNVITSTVLDDRVDVPLYFDIRSTLDMEYSPFIDARIGGYVTNGGGLYSSVTVGCRFAFSDSYAVNVGVGYSWEESKRLPKSEGLTLRVGFEF